MKAISKTSLSWLLCLNLLGLSTCEDRFIDMTYPLEEATLHWPKVTPFTLKRTYEGVYNQAPYMEANDLHTAEHLGTHMDAPAHFAKGKLYLDEIPIENFIGPAVVIDITAKAAKEKDSFVTVDDLKAWEEKYGKIPDGSIILMNSGWGKFWGNNTLFRGNDTDDIRYLHFPGFGSDAAQWLLDNRNIKGVGSDTLSIDVGSSQDFLVHQILLAKNIFGLEMVANVDKIPPSGATLYVLPMKIVNGTGGATRIVAVKDEHISAANICLPRSFLAFSVILLTYLICH